jgi:hypothetical protein
MRFGVLALSAAVLAGFSSASQAALVLSQNDAATPRVYANGGGNGFGGTLGAGSISMDASGGNLTVTFTPGGGLNDVVGLYLDTRSGGFTDATMNDVNDGSRRVLTNGTRDLDDVYPISPDFGMTFGTFGSPAAVLFELNGDASIPFIQFNGSGTTMTFPLSSIGNPSVIDFFAVYSSDGGYASNESLPATTAGANQLAGNPGFGDGNFGAVNPPPASVVYDNFNRFVIPEPATLGAVAAMGLVALRRRK